MIKKEQQNNLSEDTTNLESIKNVTCQNILTTMDSQFKPNREQEIQQSSQQTKEQGNLADNQFDLTIKRKLSNQIQKISRLYYNVDYQIVNKKRKQRALISYQPNLPGISQEFPQNSTYSQRQFIILSDSKQDNSDDQEQEQYHTIVKKEYYKKRLSILNKMIIQIKNVIAQPQKLLGLHRSMLTQILEALKQLHVILLEHQYTSEKLMQILKQPQNILEELEQNLGPFLQSLNIQEQPKEMQINMGSKYQKQLVQAKTEKIQSMIQQLQSLLQQSQKIFYQKELENNSTKTLNDLEELQKLFQPLQNRPEYTQQQLQNIMAQLNLHKNNQQINQTMLYQFGNMLDTIKSFIQQPEKIPKKLEKIFKQPQKILNFLLKKLKQLKKKLNQPDLMLDKLLEILNQSIDNLGLQERLSLSQSTTEITEEQQLKNKNSDTSQSDIKYQESQQQEEVKRNNSSLNKSQNNLEIQSLKEKEKDIEKQDFIKQMREDNKLENSEQALKKSINQNQEEFLELDNKIISDKQLMQEDGLQLKNTNSDTSQSEMKYQESEQQEEAKRNNSSLNKSQNNLEIKYLIEKEKDIEKQDIINQKREDNELENTEQALQKFINPNQREYLDLHSKIKDYPFIIDEQPMQEDEEDGLYFMPPSRKWDVDIIQNSNQFNKYKSFLIEELINKQIYLCEILVSNVNEDLFIGYQEFQQSIYIDLIIQVKYNPSQEELQKDITVIKNLDFSCFQHIQIEQNKIHVLTYSVQDCVYLSQKLEQFFQNFESDKEQKEK
ncbi:hypothetical protein ABPG72_019914 [Tetrahymena utriculariae]